MSDSTVVTIDGPSGAGKGTVARLLAQALGYSLLDSGALYRLVALAASERGVDTSDAAALAKLATELDIRFDGDGEQTRVLLDGADVSKEIRAEAIGMLASKIAPYPELRQSLLQRQRDFANAAGLVADGRDMGTVVFPGAGKKIFLTASAEERTRRRVEQLRLAGEENPDAKKILADILERDERDRTRTSAPLVPAEDALQLDTSALSIQEVLKIVLRFVRESFDDQLAEGVHETS